MTKKTFLDRNAGGLRNGLYHTQKALAYLLISQESEEEEAIRYIKKAFRNLQSAVQSVEPVVSEK